MKTVSTCILLCSILLLTACSSQKRIVYLQDVQTDLKKEITHNYEISIQRNDILAIMINSQNPELALPFNMPLVSYQLGTAGVNVAQQRILGYLVDVEGYIDFPLLGKIHVEGLTRKQFIEHLKTRLIDEDLIKDPIITVEFLNARISVIGEVNRPGSYALSGERLTLLEAISQAGDLTIYGKRDRVAVIRESGNERTVTYHDLRSADLFASPYYYLQQNDVVYVEPNKAKAGQSGINQNNSIAVWVGVLSLLTSIAALIINLTN